MTSNKQLFRVLADQSITLAISCTKRGFWDAAANNYERAAEFLERGNDYNAMANCLRNARDLRGTQARQDALRGMY